MPSRNNNSQRRAVVDDRELEEFMRRFDEDLADEYISHELYMQMREPIAEVFDKVPEEYVEPIAPMEYVRDGDITRMLQTVPGILPAYQCFSTTYVPEKPSKQPDCILDDRIPILLSEKYFKFPKDPVEETTDVSIDENSNNNSDDDNNNNHIISSGGNSSSSSSSGYNGKKGNEEQGRKTEADVKRQFWTVFSDSDFDLHTFSDNEFGDTNIIPVKEMQRCTIAEKIQTTSKQTATKKTANNQTANNNKPARKYYTPYEIYMMKRGNKVNAK